MADIRDTVRGQNRTEARRIVNAELDRLNTLTETGVDEMLLACAAAYQEGTHSPREMYQRLKPWWNKWDRAERGAAINEAVRRLGLDF